MEEVNKGSKYKLLCNFASNDEVVLPQTIENTNIDGLLKPGIILFTELSTIVNEIEMDSRSEEVKVDLQSYQALIHKAEFKDLYWDIPTKKDKALQMYFENKLKPKLISRKLKLPVNQIYRDVDKIKQFIEKLSKNRDNDAYIKMKTFNEIKQSIMGIVNSMSNECITIPKISQKLNAEKSHSKKVSSYLISKILKSELGLSYKRVGHRPPRAFSEEHQTGRENYAKLIGTLDSSNFILIQLDEFTVGHSFAPNYSWSVRGTTHFISVSKPDKSYSVMTAISKQRLEFASIYHGKTNQYVFVEFLKNLLINIKDAYKENSWKVILLFDGARYHKINLINKFLEESKVTAIVGVPYSPEYTFVEFYINFIKSKLRMEMKMGK